MRCPRLEGRLDTGPEEAAVLKHLRALDLRGNFDEIIRRLEAVQKEKFTPLYAFELARAIANRSESEKDDLKRALALLEGLDDRTEGRWETLFCRAFLNLRLGRRRAALKCFKACAGMRPDDEVIDFFVEVCLRGLSQPTIEKPFRVRADEVWAALEAQATELEEAFDSITDADEVEKRLAGILEPVSASWWRLDVSAEDERIKVEISPNGWRLECFPILEFLRRVPESLSDRWIFTAGRARRDDTSFETFMAGNEVLSADDVLIWPEPHEGMWRLLVYIEDFKGTEERARIECFQAVRALIDRTVGEAARLRHHARAEGPFGRRPHALRIQGIPLREGARMQAHDAQGLRLAAAGVRHAARHEARCAASGRRHRGHHALPAARLPLRPGQEHRHGRSRRRRRLRGLPLP